MKDVSANHDVDDSKILLESMAHEHYSPVNEKEQLEVASLEGGEMLGAHDSVQVARLDTRELGQIVHHLQMSISAVQVKSV